MQLSAKRFLNEKLLTQIEGFKQDDEQLLSNEETTKANELVCAIT